MASSGESLGPIGGGGLGPFGTLGSSGDAKAGLVGLINTISSVVGFMTVVAGIWFLFQLLFAGYTFMSAGGDSKKIQESRDRIVHAFMGIVIVVGAWSLLAVVGQFFGFNTLVNPDEFLRTITIPGAR